MSFSVEIKVEGKSRRTVYNYSFVQRKLHNLSCRRVRSTSRWHVLGGIAIESKVCTLESHLWYWVGTEKSHPKALLVRACQL